MDRQIKHLYEFGAYRLDATDRLLLVEGEVVPLTPKAIDTLVVLVQNAGRVVSKDELMQAVWPDTFVEESGLARNISVLRKALGDTETGASCIETIPKRGYRFVAEVKARQVDLNGHSPDAPPGLHEPGPAPEQQPHEAIETPRAIPTVLPGVSHDTQPPSLGSKFTRGRLAVILPLGALVLAGGLELLRILLPTPVPRVLRSVPITNVGAVEAGEPWAIAGHTIYFAVHQGGSLRPMKVSTEGGEAVPVPTPFHSAAILAVSPDASQLLVGSITGVEQELPFWLLPALGGSPRRLADLTGHAATWFPGGHRILFANGRDIFVANADGTEHRKLLSVPGTPWHLRLSPDGKRLRFTQEWLGEALASLWEASANGSNLHPLLPGWGQAPTRWGEGECCGVWSADGKYYLFRSVRENGASLWVIREKRDFLHAASPKPVQIYASLGGLVNPVLSEDGRHLFVVSGRLSRELVRYDSATHRFVPYLAGIPARWVAFSRDGRWVAYVDAMDGTLWRSAVDGTKRLQLTARPSPTVFYPRWSPDAKRILFYRVDPGVRRKLYVVSSEGGKIEMLMPGRAKKSRPTGFRTETRCSSTGMAPRRGAARFGGTFAS